jgi:restriction system protein
MFSHYDLMKPLMVVLKNKNAALSNQEALALVCEYLKLDENALNLKMPSGENLIQYRLRWSKVYLKKAGLIDVTPDRKSILTNEGKKLNLKNISKFSRKDLAKYESFREFRKLGNPDVQRNNIEIDFLNNNFDVEIVPEEMIQQNADLLKDSIKTDLLEQIKSNSPTFFERLVIDLLVAMGYGGSHQDAAQAIGKTNDGGIDGVISEDRLGLDKIYIQAKRWENTVGRPDIQQFKGALADQVAKKGVFITTSNFSKEANESAKKSGIVLIDGDKLTSLMIEFGLGVQVERSFHIYKIDQDRFDEDTF